MGSVNLDNTGSGSAITLSSDGTSLLLDGTAIGGGGSDPDLYSDSANGSAVTPTSNAGSSYNSVAIGNGADIGSGRGDSIAIGTDALTNQSQALAIGRSATVNSSGTWGTAVGRNSVVNGQAAVALGQSYASGVDAFAAAIANNSSAYGAKGNFSIAMGQNAVTQSNFQVAIGNGATGASTSNNAVALGQSYVSGTDSLSAAIATNSSSYGALHDNGVALGYQATTSAAKQIALGSSTAQVKISGTYTLPTADGSANQVLQTDGSGALSFATVSGGGGADLYAANESSPSAQPSAIGANAVAIGDSAVSRDTSTFAGPHSRADGDYSVALGIGNNSSSYGAGGDYSISLGYQSRAMALQSATLGAGAYVDSDSSRGLALGENSFVQQCDYGTAIGAAARVHGGNSATEATAFGSSYASGTSSFAAAIANNTSSYGSTGANSIAMGKQAKARDTRAVSIGYNTDVNGYGGVAIGSNCYVNQGYGVAMGNYARTHARYGAFIYANGYLADAGDAQTGIMVLRKATTDATPSAITSTGGAASSANQLVLTNESAITFTGTVVVREDATDGDDYAGWEIKGVIMRQGQASDTTLGVGIVNNLYHTAGLANASVALSADTSNGALQVEATGIAATNLHWVATLNFSEVKNF